MFDHVDVILHRPQSSENIGAVARAMKNFRLARLVMVSPRRYDAQQAGKLAVHAQDVLENARLALTLEEAIAPYVLVVPTTERSLPGREPPIGPSAAAQLLAEKAASGRVALLFGAEASGLTTALMGRFPVYSSIPANPERRSLNLAQAVLLYAWEIHKQLESIPKPERVPAELAPFQLVSAFRERARRLLLDAGFLNPQQPDRALDELMRMLQRADPTKRELEMLLAAMGQIERTSVVRKSSG